jgi:transcriptional regulator GlxA family with amidase domain
VYSKDSMMSVALAVGYSVSAPMIAHYKQAFGLSPKADRERVNAFRVKGNFPLPTA